MSSTIVYRNNSVRNTNNNWDLGSTDITVGEYTYTVTTFGGRYVFQNSFNGKSYGPEATQTERITAYLSNGYAIDQAAALEMFGCKNLRAAISVIRAKVERYGNWRIVTNEDNTEYALKRIVLLDPLDAAEFL